MGRLSKAFALPSRIERAAECHNAICVARFMRSDRANPADEVTSLSLPHRLALDGLSDLGQELLHLERLEQHCLQSLLRCADDAVVGVVAEAGHEDDRERLALAAGAREDVVAGLVGGLFVL